MIISLEVNGKHYEVDIDRKGKRGIIAMARYSKESKLEVEEVFRRADTFFGSGGLGLKVVERNECSLSFEGGGGHVTVAAARCKPNYTLVDLETREWDYQVKKFMEKL